MDTKEGANSKQWQSDRQTNRMAVLERGHVQFVQFLPPSGQEVKEEVREKGKEMESKEEAKEEEEKAEDEGGEEPEEAGEVGLELAATAARRRGVGGEDEGAELDSRNSSKKRRRRWRQRQSRFSRSSSRRDGRRGREKDETGEEEEGKWLGKEAAAAAGAEKKKQKREGEIAGGTDAEERTEEEAGKIWNESLKDLNKWGQWKERKEKQRKGNKGMHRMGTNGGENFFLERARKGFKSLQYVNVLGSILLLWWNHRSYPKQREDDYAIHAAELRIDATNLATIRAWNDRIHIALALFE